jgi:hypothetical protein
MTMPARLRISRELSLPLDAVTETFAILAKRRAGKSNAAVVMAEEMYDHGLPWVAIDPKGDWWGVRAAGDGKAAGLSVLVFGGLHGDVPLEPTSGQLVADLVVDQRLTCVLDVSEMNKADQRKFLMDFADRLYRTNREPLHVFCEEADEYIPQQVRGENAKLVGVFETLVKRGGFRGIGITLITQRSASLNKDVLTQIETLIPMRTPSPQDRKAVLAWVDYHASGKEAVDELPGLKDGEAWVFSPQWLSTLVKIKFRRRRTFDSGATPKVGGKPRPPATLAAVDLDSIKTAMADTIEKARADDPKHLRKEVTRLTRELEKAQNATTPEPVVETVEVSVLTDKDRELLTASHAELMKGMTKASELAADAASIAADVADVVARVREALHGKSAAPRELGPRVNRAKSVTSTNTPRREPTGPIEIPANVDSEVKLGKTERTILAVLAEHGPRTHGQLALLSGYSQKASTIGVALGKLRKLGYVADGQPITATDAGIEWLGDYEPLPTGQALIEYWRHKFGKTERIILDALLSVYPESTNQVELADMTGYSSTASTIGVALGKLRKVGVVDGWRISDDFAQGADL